MRQHLVPVCAQLTVMRAPAQGLESRYCNTLELTLQSENFQHRNTVGARIVAMKMDYIEMFSGYHRRHKPKLYYLEILAL